VFAAYSRTMAYGASNIKEIPIEMPSQSTNLNVVPHNAARGFGVFFQTVSQVHHFFGDALLHIQMMSNDLVDVIVCGCSNIPLSNC
jgi:hypothetical protein